MSATSQIRVTLWNEFRHERKHEHIKNIYPDGMHKTIADALQKQGFSTRLAAQDDVEHGLTDDVWKSSTLARKADEPDAFASRA